MICSFQQQYLRSEEESKEEVTLQLLLNLSSQCGICFPCNHSSSSPLSSLHSQLTASSIQLLHTVWDDVRLQLRRYLMDRLFSRSPDLPGPRQTTDLSILERVQCLQQMFFLYPESEVLQLYQGLKRQYVLGILHSTLSASQIGETGFDRLAMGFCSMVPILSQALKEELHVLSALAEPQTILGFINEAYLNTVATEFASLMERECETAHRDNTAPSVKTKKYSVRSRATVAPLELPTKSRSFSLTSHQLRALTQLACTLLGFESDVKELVTNTIFIDCTGDTPPIKGNQLLQNAKVLEFNWRSAFKGLVPHMEHCVKVVLDNVCAKNLQQEEELHSSGHISIFPLLLKSSCLMFAISLPPQFCGAIMTEMDALLPLAAACNESSLLQVRSSFIESCGRAAFAMLGRLQERALEVPSSAPLKNLHALLATCIYVHQRLETLTPLPVQKYKDTVEAMREQLTSYCIQACYTCILQDAESHHWADPKPFYEGERCSFSVQMWFYFLCGLRSDLWAVLPAELARDVLGQVLTDTLQLLVRRYARARASYRRHLQIRCDITAMLLYVEHLMWSLCESPETLVRYNPSSVITIIAGGSDWPYQIHNLCEQLLTVLVIVTAPLSLLHRWQTSTSPDTAELSTLFSFLLSSISPRDGLMGQASLACQLRLLTSDPGCNPKLLLQMLLYRDCHLPRILLENSCKSVVFARVLPVVVSCVRDIVTKSTNSLLLHLVSMVLGWQATEEPGAALFKHTVPENVLAKIPKDWNYTPLDVKGKDTVAKSMHRLTIQALSFIFTNLPMAVASLPLPIRFLFQVAEKHLSQHARQLRLVGLLIWALLGCLIQGLEDPDTLEQISGLALDRSAKDRLSLLAECVQGVPKPSVHKVIQALEEKRPKWTQLQLQKARKLCSDSVFEQGSERGLAAAELTEQKIGLMLLEVCHKAGGSSYLRQIYHIIQGNEVGKDFNEEEQPFKTQVEVILWNLLQKLFF
uniref:KIAA0825 n=1 Tax=Oreochromis aureus TaxID=47969 RepID=A0A668TTM9_OREAU